MEPTDTGNGRNSREAWKEINRGRHYGIGSHALRGANPSVDDLIERLDSLRGTSVWMSADEGGAFRLFEEDYRTVIWED